MDRSRLEQLVEKWRSELITVPPAPYGGSAKSYNGALTACADELESLLKDSQEGKFAASEIPGDGYAWGDFSRNDLIDLVEQLSAQDHSSPPDAVQLEGRARELLADAYRDGGYKLAAEALLSGRTDSLDECALAAIAAALSAAPETQRQAQGEVASSDRVCNESDGCPTEGAVLKRFWRSVHTDDTKQLMAFYGVADIPALIEQQVQHVQVLQVKLKAHEPKRDQFPKSPREG